LKTGAYDALLITR